jgi:hypothetical protein
MTGTETGRSPSILDMVVILEKRGFIKRIPGASRSIQLLLSLEKLPNLT